MSNAVTLRRDTSILFNRIVIKGLILSCILALSSLFVNSLDKGIGLYGGLFHISSFTQSFHIFIILISAIILNLTAFYPRKVYVKEHSSLFDLLLNRFEYNVSKISNKMGEQFRIIEYPLIIVFIITGGIFLISTSDFISLFLSIELQSYGLYILCTLYRDSELATSGGLTYFLLGGLSSCFILLGASLIYASSGTTNLEAFYVISSITEILDLHNGLVFGYNSYYIHLSLLVLSVGFLFKVSAAPFHF
jgi:NADH-ubiquinone oxidoreductase chain 2